MYWIGQRSLPSDIKMEKD